MLTGVLLRPLPASEVELHAGHVGGASRGAEGGDQALRGAQRQTGRGRTVARLRTGEAGQGTGVAGDGSRRQIARNHQSSGGGEAGTDDSRLTASSSAGRGRDIGGGGGESGNRQVGDGGGNDHGLDFHYRTSFSKKNNGSSKTKN